MPHRSRKESRNGFYHVFVRGINHEFIFNQTREKSYFLKILRKHLKEYDVEIYAFCIMSTHAHFIIKSEIIQELSMFMSKVLAEYASYYNYKKNRNGHVFQGRFGSECIDDMDYFWNCIRYIHLNPVKAHMISLAWEYPYSSLKEYKSSRCNIINKKAIELYKSRFENWNQFLEYHYGKNTILFIGTKMELYEQQKELAVGVLQEIKDEEQLENIREVFEEKELREKFINEISKRMKISKEKVKKIYREIKQEIIV